MEGPECNLEGPGCGLEGLESGLEGPECGLEGPENGLEGPESGLEGHERIVGRALRAPGSDPWPCRALIKFPAPCRAAGETVQATLADWQDSGELRLVQGGCTGWEETVRAEWKMHLFEGKIFMGEGRVWPCARKIQEFY